MTLEKLLIPVYESYWKLSPRSFPEISEISEITWQIPGNSRSFFRVNARIQSENLSFYDRKVKKSQRQFRENFMEISEIRKILGKIFPGKLPENCGVFYE